MGSLVLTGDTSGSVTVAVPLVAGSNTATIAAATGTHFPFSAGTVVNSTSGTSIDFTGIPSWAKRVTVILSGISTNGTSNLQLQIGAGSITTSGYDSRSANIDGTNATTATTATSGFLLKTSVAAASSYVGIATLTLLTGNTWVGNSSVNAANGMLSTQNGSLVLGGTLDRLRIIASSTGSPSDTFDAGSINILFE